MQLLCYEIFFIVKRLFNMKNDLLLISLSSKKRGFGVLGYWYIMTVIMCTKKFMTSMSCESDGGRITEKGAKLPKNHEKHIGPINALPKRCSFEVFPH